MAALIWHPIRRLLGGQPSAPSIDFDPARDVPSLAGKVILITGGAGDLGKQLAIEYARRGPSRIYIADLPLEDGGEAVIQSIRDGALAPESVVIKFLDIDLASFESVRSAAAKLKTEVERLDIMVLNAGVVLIKHELSKDGYELTWAINFMGHALLTKLLVPALLQSASQPDADIRIIIVSSEGHAMVPRGGIAFDKLKTPCNDIMYMQRYGQTKLAAIFFARQLAQRHPEIKTVSVHPGRIITGIFRRMQKDNLLFKYTAPITPLFCTSVENGVRNHLWASTTPKEALVNGAYYEPVGILGKESALARDEDLSKKLWEWVEGELASQTSTDT